MMISRAWKLGGLVFGALLVAACGGKTPPDAQVPSAPEGEAATDGSCGGKKEGSCGSKKDAGKTDDDKTDGGGSCGSGSCGSK